MALPLQSPQAPAPQVPTLVLFVVPPQPSVNSDISLSQPPSLTPLSLQREPVSLFEPLTPRLLSVVTVSPTTRGATRGQRFSEPRAVPHTGQGFNKCLLNE